MESDRNQDPEIERLLRSAMGERPPEPPPDLIQRTIGRVRRLIVFGDLLRLATLEAIWGGYATREDGPDYEDESQRRDAHADEERHTW